MGGVTYGSEGADYAEYLLKVHQEEIFLPGQIVGVFDGKVSKVTQGADQIMSVSINPVVLGNTPPQGEEDQYEKIGFMGQVPVFVYGEVKIGDFIVPSGRNDGVGIAVSADALAVKHMEQILGRAWSASDTQGLELINVAIGIKTNEWAEIFALQEKKINELKTKINKERIARIKDRMAQLESRLSEKLVKKAELPSFVGEGPGK